MLMIKKIYSKHVKKDLGLEGKGGGRGGVGEGFENCAYVWKNPGYTAGARLSTSTAFKFQSSFVPRALIPPCC